MEAGERFRMALEALGDHPRRAVASAMGVFWGAAAIVLLLSWGAGFREFVRRELTTFGEPCIFISAARTSSGFPGYRAGIPVRIGRDAVAQAEAEQTERVRAVLPVHLSKERVLVEAGGRFRRLDLNATDERYARYRAFEMAHGRFYAEGEVARSRSVAVLGWDSAVALFERPEDAVGRTLRVDGRNFEVIGVAARKGRQYTSTLRPDNQLLLLPLTAAEDRLGYDRERLGRVLIYPRAGVDGGEAVRGVLGSLGPLSGFHPDDGDAVWQHDVAQYLVLVDLLYAGFMIFVGVAGTITLLIGAVGIANYHLATLAERTVEIAVAKAIGARNGSLVLQSVLEALIVAGGAAALGVGLGLLGCWALATLPPPGTLPKPEVSALSLGVAFAALVAVSLVAALLPARRVRNMGVSAALRVS